MILLNHENSARDFPRTELRPARPSTPRRSLPGRPRPVVRCRPGVDLLEGRCLLSQGAGPFPAAPSPFTMAEIGPHAGESGGQVPFWGPAADHPAPRMADGYRQGDGPAMWDHSPGPPPG